MPNISTTRSKAIRAVSRGVSIPLLTPKICSATGCLASAQKERARASCAGRAQRSRVDARRSVRALMPYDQPVFDAFEQVETGVKTGPIEAVVGVCDLVSHLLEQRGDALIENRGFAGSEVEVDALLVHTQSL